MNRLALAALAFVLAAPAALAQPADLVVTFSRSVSTVEATRLVHEVAPGAQTPGTAFAPLYVSARFSGPVGPEVLGALFGSGAVSVEVTRSAAQLAALGTPIGVEATEARGFGGYVVRAGYPSTAATAETQAAFVLATGAAETWVEKRENEVRMRVPSAEVAAVTERLRSRAGVVGVHVE